MKNLIRYCHECFHRGAKFCEKFCKIQKFGVCENTKVKTCRFFREKNTVLSESEITEFEEIYESSNLEI